MDIKFHCDEKNNFKECEKVRAFLYTDYQIEPHNHDFYEINIVLRGHGTHKISNASFEAKIGDVFTIPPGVIHAYCNTQQFDIFHILIKKDFIYYNRKESADVPGFLQLTEIEPFLRRHCANKMFLHLSRNELEYLKYDLNAIDEKNIGYSAKSSPLKEHTVWKILYTFSELLYRQINFDKKKNAAKYEKYIFNILEYIHKNYDKKITLETLCEKFYLTRSTLLRNFETICHCSPTQYINNYRCKKALEMSENTDLSKTQIAHSCGFYDLSHMQRAFAKSKQLP